MIYCFKKLTECHKVGIQNVLLTLINFNCLKHCKVTFNIFTEAEDVVKKKRQKVEDGYYLMIHQCQRPCDIPHDWFQVGALNSN